MWIQLEYFFYDITIYRTALMCFEQMVVGFRLHGRSKLGGSMLLSSSKLQTTCPLARNNNHAEIMMASSNENIFRVTGPLCGERPVTRGFDVFFYLSLNKKLE